MHVDLDIPADQLPPWEFTVKIDGVRYATREPSMEEQAVLKDLGQLKPAEKAVTFFWTLFCDPRPPRSTLTAARLIRLGCNLAGYMLARRSLAKVLADQAMNKASKPAPAAITTAAHSTARTMLN